MVDVEKVKAGLKCCTTERLCTPEKCPYHESVVKSKTGYCGNDLNLDALAVIEAQEKHINELHEGIVRLRDAMEAMRRG